jgi:hypothetical protein
MTNIYVLNSTVMDKMETSTNSLIYSSNSMHQICLLLKVKKFQRNYMVYLYAIKLQVCIVLILLFCVVREEDMKIIF